MKNNFKSTINSNTLDSAYIDIQPEDIESDINKNNLIETILLNIFGKKTFHDQNLKQYILNQNSEDDNIDDNDLLVNVTDIFRDNDDDEISSVDDIIKKVNLLNLDNKITSKSNNINCNYLDINLSK